MGKEVTIVSTLQDTCIMANAIATSGLFGMRTKEQALALMLVAQSEGLHPARAAMEYHIIQGRPTLKADAMLARFQNAGGKVDWHKYDHNGASATFSHPQGGTIKVELNVEDAIRAELFRVNDKGQRTQSTKDGWRVGNWEKFGRAMFRSRVISEGVRTVFPGVSVGMYTPEEAENFDDKTIDSKFEVVAPEIKPEAKPESNSEPSTVSKEDEEKLKLADTAQEFVKEMQLSDTAEKLEAVVKRFVVTTSKLATSLPKWHSKVTEIIEAKRLSFAQGEEPAADNLEIPGFLKRTA